jgi:vacuolar-type H+-ATPase subunit I/STV1
MVEKTKQELNKVKFFYINKANKIRRITSQLMNKINNSINNNDNSNKSLAHNIYTKELHKIQQLDATFELLESQLQDLKQTIKYFEETEIEKTQIDEEEINDKDNNTQTKKNNLLKSDLDLLFPIMYMHLNSGV